jgi:stage II sporulation protein M
MIIKNSRWLNYFTGLYNRNKFILTIATSIFFVSVFVGISVGYFLPDFTINLLNAYVKALLSMHIEKTTLSIFSHNLQAALLNYLGGIIGIIPVGVLSSNGFSIGAFFGYLINHSYETAIGFLSAREFLIYILPHGIFEIPGFIISGAAGFRLTTIVIDMIKNTINKTPEKIENWKIKDSLSLLSISIILLFIAAIIEANITLTLGKILTGL